jgi:sec-independent protein translocase protein TatB
MFDIGFWELTLIAVIALLVVGPERLPELARTTGLWVNRIRGFINTVKRDVERELRAEELKQMLNRQNELDEVHEILEETRHTLSDTTHDLSQDITSSPSKQGTTSSEQSAGNGARVPSASRRTTPKEQTSPPGLEAEEQNQQTASNADAAGKHGEKAAQR